MADIVSEAREQVLAEYPNISGTGGELYPPVRAEACWRDFWHFLGCITYGIAGNTAEFTSDEGLHNMNLLYFVERASSAFFKRVQCVSFDR